MENDRIRASFFSLDLEQIDSNIVDFFNKNLDVYGLLCKNIIEDEDRISIEFFDLENSFNITFIPNLLNPKKVLLKLKNLCGILEQSYEIEFLDENIVRVEFKKDNKEANKCYSTEIYYKDSEQFKRIKLSEPNGNQEIYYKNNVEISFLEYKEAIKNSNCSIALKQLK